MIHVFTNCDYVFHPLYPAFARLQVCKNNIMLNLYVFRCKTEKKGVGISREESERGGA